MKREITTNLDFLLERMQIKSTKLQEQITSRLHFTCSVANSGVNPEEQLETILKLSKQRSEIEKAIELLESVTATGEEKDNNVDVFLKYIWIKYLTSQTAYDIMFS